MVRHPGITESDTVLSHLPVQISFSDINGNSGLFPPGSFPAITGIGYPVPDEGPSLAGRSQNPLILYPKRFILKTVST